MRTSLIVMLVMAVMACAGLALMMNHLKGVLSSEAAGFQSLITAIGSESTSAPSLVVENHDGLRVLRIGLELPAGGDARARARRVGDLAWQKVGAVQSLDGVFVDWKGQGGGSLEVDRPGKVVRGRIGKVRAVPSRPDSRPGEKAAPGR